MNSDILSIYNVVTPILKFINENLVNLPYNIWGIITPTDKYLDRYNTAFVFPARRTLLDTTITQYTPNAVLHQAEAEHIALLNDRALNNTANNGIVNLSCTIVKETWYQDLKDTDAYYSEVMSTPMLAHFRDNCIGLYKVNVITIQGEMMDCSRQAEGITLYINMMEVVQARAKRVNPINLRQIPCPNRESCNAPH